MKAGVNRTAVDLRGRSNSPPVSSHLLPIRPGRGPLLPHVKGALRPYEERGRGAQTSRPRPGLTPHRRPLCPHARPPHVHHQATSDGPAAARHDHSPLPRRLPNPIWHHSPAGLVMWLLPASRAATPNTSSLLNLPWTHPAIEMIRSDQAFDRPVGWRAATMGRRLELHDPANRFQDSSRTRG